MNDQNNSIYLLNLMLPRRRSLTRSYSFLENTATGFRPLLAAQCCQMRHLLDRKNVVASPKCTAHHLEIPQKWPSNKSTLVPIVASTSQILNHCGSPSHDSYQLVLRSMNPKPRPSCFNPFPPIREACMRSVHLCKAATRTYVDAMYQCYSLWYKYLEVNQ